MNVYYRSGSYCTDIACRDYGELAAFRGYDYALMKGILCKKCSAWNFYQWLEHHHYIILRRSLSPVGLELSPESVPISTHPLRDLDDKEVLQFYCKVSRIFRDCEELNEKETIALQRLLEHNM